MPKVSDESRWLHLLWLQSIGDITPHETEELESIVAANLESKTATKN